jgi:hypothetical protein
MAILYALHDGSVPSQELAEGKLAVILADEPQWCEVLDVSAVEFEVSAN